MIRKGLAFIEKRKEKADLGKRYFDGKDRPAWLYYVYSSMVLAAYVLIFVACARSVASFSNLINSLVFVARSFGYFVARIYELNPSYPPTAFDTFDWSVNFSPMGSTWQGVADTFRTWGLLLVNWRFALDNLTGGAQWLLNFTRVLFFLALLALPLYLLFIDYFKNDEELSKRSSSYKCEEKAAKAAKRKGICWHYYKKGNRWSLYIRREVLQETRPLAAYKKTIEPLLRFSADFVLGFFRFVFGYWYQPDQAKNRKRVSRRPWVWHFAAIALAYYFNFGSAFFDFFGYYYLFFASFSPVVLGKWVATGFVLFWPLFSAVWPVVWVCFDYWLFDTVRCAMGKRKEAKEKKKNRKAAKKCGVSNIKDGPPGTSKSTSLVMEGRDSDEELRERCFDDMSRSFFCFPAFPWMVFRRDLKKEIDAKDSDVRNSAQAAAWAYAYFDSLKINMPRYFETIRDGDLFYFDGAAVITLEEAMANDAKAFFFNQTRHPLVCSSFPMLVECSPSSATSLVPSYAHKSLKTNFAHYPEKRQFSFIADEDAWKILRPINKDGNASGDLEGIVWLLDETNKIYPNKTDKWSGWRLEDGIKDSWSLWRHYTCIWSDPTISFSVVSQRYGDLPVNVTSRIEAEKTVTAQSETRSFLFMWVYSRLFDEILLKGWKWFDKKFKGARDDESLLHYLASKIAAPLGRRYWERRKGFDYFKEAVHVCYHASESVGISRDYVRTMIVCDVYGGWFATDVQKDRVNAERIQSGHCFMDAGQWTGLYPTNEQELLRNSYEGRDVEKLADGKSNGEKPGKDDIKL